MYESFFHLREKPFNLTPSHRFLYLSEGHKEALALLTYGVTERKGFVLLTGDVGTGKTTLIQALLNRFGTDVELVHFSNPLLSPAEFMDHLASSTFKRRIHFKSKSDFLFEFEAYLREAQQHQRAFILLIDEAQALSMEVLEEIRLLSNLESSEEKLINILLVGQPELTKKLQEPQCRALNQRIAGRHILQPLNGEETAQYIKTRLRVAGAETPDDIFPKRTIDALYRYSGGIPRTINVLADNALLLGYSQGKGTITPHMVEATHRDMHLGEEPLEPAEEGTPDRVPDTKRRSDLRRAVWLVAVFLLLAAGALLAGVVLSDLLKGAAFRLQGPEESPSRTAGETPAEPSPPLPARASRTEATPAPESSQPKQPEEPVPAGTPPGGSPSAPGLSLGPGRMTFPPPPRLEPSEGREGIPPSSASPSATGKTKRVVVKEGDYLAKLALQVYGRADPRVIDAIRVHNPDLRDIHTLSVGQVLVFPSLESPSRKETYTVHIASYDRMKEAQATFRALMGAGYDVFVIPFQATGEPVRYRITVGHFEDRETAQVFVDRLLDHPEFSAAEVIQLRMDEGVR